ncbi:MAG: glycosyltransferase [Myxococcota bacterium]
MAVHQLVPNFVPGDAMGQAALHCRLLLRRLGHAGELYAAEVAPELASLVRSANELRPAPDDLVLYHHGIASPLAGRLLHLPCKKGVVFHNISPPWFYERTPLHEALVSGRAQLAAMAEHADLAIGVSRFNAEELVAAGFREVHVVPLFVEPGRFAPSLADPQLMRRLGRCAPYLLAVSRVVAHKRVEDLLALHRELRRLEPDAHLVVVGGLARGDAYFRRLQREAEEAGNVLFLGKVTHAELVAAYRGAGAFVSMSEHEGFGVPLVEAFAAEVPVLAFAAAAVPETLGGRGVAFDEKRFAYLAEVAQALMTDVRLRGQVVEGQKERLKELSAAGVTEALGKAIESVCHRPSPLPSPKGRGRPRVALVVQRYGEDITGGAEAHARQVAHRLATHFHVTVLTSCAKDHLTWANELPVGKDRDGPVNVVRFAAARERRIRPFNQLSRQVFGKANDRLAEEHWVAAQGPLLPELLEHLSREPYDGVVLFTYLYAPTVWGLPLVSKRALLVPTAHDEPPLWMGVYDDVFTLPRALLCNTPEELALIERRCPQHARARVVGVGVEVPKTRPSRFREKYGLDQPYLMYVGRVEEGKGVGELLAHHAALRERFHDAPMLVLAGAASMEVRGDGVRYLGRISEQDKYDGLAGALAAVVPSRYESLSLLALEAFACGTPVLGNGASEVVAGQLARSQAGMVYNDRASFVAGVRRLGEEREALGARALRFAAQHSWEKVIDIYREELGRILEDRRHP